jgi:hypothetical protein
MDFSGYLGHLHRPEKQEIKMSVIGLVIPILGLCCLLLAIDSNLEDRDRDKLREQDQDHMRGFHD